MLTAAIRHTFRLIRHCDISMRGLPVPVRICHRLLNTPEKRQLVRLIQAALRPSGSDTHRESW